MVHSVLKSPSHSSPETLQAIPETLQALGDCIMQSTLGVTDFDGRISEMVEALPFSMAATTVEFISRMFTSNLVKGSGVLKLYETRMNMVVFKAFHTNNPDVFTSIAPQVMLVIGTELRKHVHVLRMVLGVNLRVYASHYSRIIQEKASTVSTK